MSALIAVIAFGVLVFIHELGHFIFAKIFGVYVEKFSIGFGPKVFGKKIGETEYLLSAVPLGGYVKMYGENPDETVQDSLKDKAFSNKKLYQKSLIVFAGPLFNYLFAILLFWIVFNLGIHTLKPVIGEVQKDMPAAKADIKSGDAILSINGLEIKSWDDMARIIKVSVNKPLLIKIKRGEDILEKTVTPQTAKSKNIFGEDINIGLLGIKPSGETFLQRFGPVESFVKANQKCYEIVELTFLGIVKMFQRVVPADNIGGPIMIFQMTKDAAQFGLTPLLTFVALISINLAILNLLPIPVLDGGHLLIYAIEAIIRRPLSEKAKSIAIRIGMSFLIGLMVFAFYNDIMRIFRG
ncbi:RIP metalloprotease RseP [Calditerrivibrio sp.]|jgi:regulator of sigma E protease|uniref:RIP metalloprotease RseP n=1 Tax=Calditerrivibrio sp. TaxID=2792612 RepID=UPI003D0C0229